MSADLAEACRSAAEAGRTADGPGPRPDPDDAVAVLLAAADSWGAAEAATASALDHVRARHQFGRPLAAFQAVQHHLADMAIAVDGLGLAVAHACEREGWDPDPAAVAVAAVLAIERAPLVCTTAHQITGAAGLYLDHPLARWTPRVFATAVALGPVERHLDRLVPPLR